MICDGCFNIIIGAILSAREKNYCQKCAKEIMIKESKGAKKND
jgi:hypothetical protein